MTRVQSSPVHVSGAEVTKAAAWLRGNTVLIAGLALIALSLWWKALFLGRSYFRQDDYLYLDRAAHSNLSWNYLMWADAGHLNPLGHAIAWFEERLSPVDWTLACAVTLILLAITGLGLLRLLRTLFGDHPGTLVLLALYVLSPLSLSGLSWWTVTLELLPLQLALFFGVTAHVRYLRTGRPRYLAQTAAWLVAAMASSLRGAAIPLLLFALTSGYLIDGAWARSAWLALRRLWRAWALYAALAAGYLVLYGIQLTTSSVRPSRPGPFSGVFSYAATQLRDNFIPGALGGPWRWLGAGVSAAADPPVALARISWAVAAVVVIISLVYRPRAWRAWSILAGWLVIVDMVPALLGRASFVTSVLLGLVTRYVWDATGVLSLCLGLAFLPLVWEQGRPGRADGARRAESRLRRPLRTAVVGLVTAVVIGSIWSYRSYPSDPDAAAARSFVATARIALSEAPAGTVVVDNPVPRDVTGGQHFSRRTSVSGLLGPLVSGSGQARPRFIPRPDGTYAHLMEFDGWGRLVPAVISGAASPPLAAGKSCLAVRQGTLVVRLTSVARHARYLRIGYLAGSAARLTIEFAGRIYGYTVRRGLQAAVLPVTGSGRVVIIETLSGKVPCIGDVRAGVLLPAGAGPAIPPLAVNG